MLDVSPLNHAGLNRIITAQEKQNLVIPSDSGVSEKKRYFFGVHVESKNSHLTWRPIQQI